MELDIAKSIPLPESGTFWGLPAALSVMVSVPASEPPVAGEKVTLILQEPPVATLLPQLLVSPQLALVATLVMMSAALPVLLRVTGCDELAVPTSRPANVRLDADKLAAAPSPAPLRVTVWGLLLALSVSVSVPVRFPVAVGVKVTLIVATAPAATEPAQVLVWAKSPLVVIVRGVRTPAPVLVSASVCGGLEVETVCPAKLRLVAERLTTGARPVPLRVTVWGLFLALSVSVSVPVRFPAAVGVKVTPIVQPAPTATEPAQVLVWAKSPVVVIVSGVRDSGPRVGQRDRLRGRWGMKLFPRGSSGWWPKG